MCPGFMLLIFSELAQYLLTVSLVRIEYDEFYAQWAKDGKPHGIPLWIPKEDYGTKGLMYLRRKWLRIKPDWIEKSESAKIVYRRLQSIFLLQAIGLLLILSPLISLAK